MKAASPNNHPRQKKPKEFSARQVAALSNYSYSGVRALINRGQIPACHIRKWCTPVGEQWLIDEEGLKIVQARVKHQTGRKRRKAT